MSSKKHSILDIIDTALFINFGIPVLALIIIVMIVIACVQRVAVGATIDKETSITYSDFRETVSEIALEVGDTSEFDIEIEEYSSKDNDIEISYTIKNTGKTAEEYDTLIKEEITKVDNEIKDKKIVNNTLFGQVENLDIIFRIKTYLAEGKLKYIGIASINYGEDNWSSSYQETMNTEIVTQEKLDSVNE